MIGEQRVPDERIQEMALLRAVDLLHSINDWDWDEAIRLSREVARIISNGRVRIVS